VPVGAGPVPAVADEMAAAGPVGLGAAEPVGAADNPVPVGAADAPVPVGAAEDPVPVGAADDPVPVGAAEDPVPIGAADNPVPVGAAVGLAVAAGLDVAVAAGFAVGLEVAVGLGVGACARASRSSPTVGTSAAIKRIAVFSTAEPGRAVIVLFSCGIAAPTPGVGRGGSFFCRVGKRNSFPVSDGRRCFVSGDSLAVIRFW
jgi:hypothetical protein